MKLSVPESKLNSNGGGWGGETGANRKRKGENWMGKCLGERGLNKKAASGICGLEMEIEPRKDCESTAAPRIKLYWQRNISSSFFLTSEPMVYAHNIIHSHNNYSYNS